MTSKIIIVILSLVALSLVFYTGRLGGIEVGRQEQKEKFDKEIQEYKTALSNQAETLNKALQIQSVDLSKEVNGLLRDTQTIKQQLKNQPQPLVLIKEGECKASDAVLEARRKMIERVNK